MIRPAIIFVALAFVVLLASCEPTRAQTQCLPTAVGLKALQENAGEVLRHRATLENGREVLVTVAPSGSWSVLVVVDGMACMVASGSEWREPREVGRQ